MRKLGQRVRGALQFSSPGASDFGPVSGLESSDVNPIATSPGYSGQGYKTYAPQVAAVALAFEGRADWGNQPLRSLVEVRAAFTIANGLEVIADKQADRVDETVEWVKDFMQRSGLDNRETVELAQEAEIEGKSAVRLFLDSDGQVDMRWLSWSTLGYTIQSNPEDYRDYQTLSYKVKDQQDPVVVNPADFVYRPFGGRANAVNLTYPKLGSIIGRCEYLDKALRDWREINHLHASPTPFFDCENAKIAKTLHDILAEKRWNIGKRLTLSGAKFSLVTMPTGGIDSLEREITACAKQISGASGVPVHFLGFPELMSNRSTADNLMQMPFAATVRDRNVWKSFYTELFRKAIKQNNEAHGTSLNPAAVSADIPYWSALKLAEIADVWLPLYLGGALTLNTLLEKLPEVDAASEATALNAIQEIDIQKTDLNLGGGPNE